MKGVIVNLVEDVVRDEHGDDVWDEVVDRAGSDTASVVRHVGRRSIASLAARYPEFFHPHEDVRSFLMTLNGIIHPEVRTLYPGATPPTFDLRSEDPAVLELVYRSARGRCDLAEGPILRAAAHYGPTVELPQPQCAERGDEVCVMRVRTS